MDSRISSFVQQDQLVYWYALAFMQGVVKGHKSLTTERKNSIYIAAYKHTPRLSLSLLSISLSSLRWGLMLWICWVTRSILSCHYATKRPVRSTATYK